MLTLVGIINLKRRKLYNFFAVIISAMRCLLSHFSYGSGTYEAAGKFAVRDKPVWMRGSCVIYAAVLKII